MRVTPVIGASMLAGAAASFVVASDETGINGGPQLGLLVPAATGVLTLGALAVGVASRSAWRWTGGEALNAAARGVARPLLAATIGGVAGVGIAMVTEPIGGAQPDRSAQRADAADAEATRLRAANDSRDAAVQEQVDEHTAERARARAEVDRLYDANGGSFVPAGTPGSGRIDVAGRSPEAAIDLLLEAYGDHDGKLGTADVRIVGPATFALTRLIQSAGGGDVATRDQLVSWFAAHVDTRAPKGSIDSSESIDWQSGRFGEERSAPSTVGGAR